MSVWYPSADLSNKAPESSWGAFIAWAKKRGVLHSTETDGPNPTSGSYFGENYWPHFTVFETINGVIVYQHIPVDRAARALAHPGGTAETNNQGAIQIEIVGRAVNAPNFSRRLLDGLRDLMRWIEQNTGVQRHALAFHYYPPENSIQLGHEPWRLSDADWLAYDGWCGHQHIASGNVHGDPGKIDIEYLLDQNQKVVTPLFSPPWQTCDLLLTPSGKGAWLLQPDGGIATFGDAQYLGGAAGQPYFAGRTAARLSVRKDGQPGYSIVDSAGESYSYP